MQTKLTGFIFKKGLVCRITAWLLCILSAFSASSQINVSGTQTGVWTTGNTYVLTGDVTVPQGQSLIIQPGVTVHFARASYNLIVNGTLNAAGNATDSIHFIGKADLPWSSSSDYGGAVILNTSQAVLSYIRIDSLGDNGWNGNTGAIYIQDTSKPVINHCRITNTESLNQLSSWAGGAENVQTDNVQITLRSGSLSRNSTLAKIGNNSYYHLQGDIIVNTGFTMTMQPGTVVHFPRATFNLVIHGALNAVGNATDSIRFIGKPDLSWSASSEYGGALFLNSSHSVLSYIRIDSLGDNGWNGNAGAIYIQDTSKPVINHCLITHTESFNQISSWAGGAEYVVSDNIIIAIRSESLSRNSVLARTGNNSYYILQGDLTVNAGFTMTMQPGTVIHFPRATYNLVIHGTLNAIGNETDSIRLIGKSDPSWSSSSDYGGALFLNSSQSVLSYVRLDSLGDNGWNGNTGAIYIQDTSKPSINHCYISNTESPNQILSWAGGAENIFLDNTVVGLRAENLDRNSVLVKTGNNSYYRLQGNITVNPGATMTMQPGTILHFPRFNYNLVVNGKLLAIGTVADSIRFIGKSDYNHSSASSHGGSIIINDTAQLKFVSIDSLGDTGNYGYAIRANHNQCSIENSNIRHSEDIGIYVETNAKPEIAGCFIAGSGTDISTWLGGGEFITGNIDLVIGLRSTTVSTACVLSKPGINSVYQLSGNITVNSPGSLTIQPGTVIQFPRFSYHLIMNGKLTAIGTITDSIRFIGKSDYAYSSASSHGGTIMLNDTAQLKYVVIDSLGDTGAYSYALRLNNDACNITHTNIRNSEDIGVYIETNAKPALSACILKGNSTDISTWLGGGEFLAGNTNVVIGLRGSSTSAAATLAKPGNNAYYKLLGTITVNSPGSLTIQPGVTIQFPRNTYHLVVNGKMTAVGTPIDSIRFLGKSDYNYSSASSHGGTIFLNDTTTLKYVVIDSLGDASAYSYALLPNHDQCSISNSNIRNSENTGIYINAGIKPVISANTFGNEEKDIDCNAMAVSGILNNKNAKLHIRQTDITSNTTFPYPGENSKYILEGNISVQPNTVLTIGAGTLVNFRDYQANLFVNGTLRAMGTEAAPVFFVKLPGSGLSSHGGTVSIESGSTNSVLSFVNFDKMGSTQAYGHALRISTSNVSISNISIGNSENIGLSLTNNASPNIVAGTFFNNLTAINSASGKTVLSNCNIYGNSSWGINNTSNVVADTIDARNCWWGDLTGPFHPTLNLGGLANPVSDKVKFNPWKNGPAGNQFADIGVSQLITPVTNCGLGNQQTVSVKLNNYGNTSQNNFAVSYRVNNGSIVTENVTSTVLPGTFVLYDFATKADLGVAGTTYIIKVFTSLAADSSKINDTLTVLVDHLPALASPSNLFPSNSALDQDIPVNFSWAPVANASGYDVYLWKTADPVPVVPVIQGLTQVNYNFNGAPLEYGMAYKWKVVAKLNDCFAESAVHDFTTRHLPDLLIDTIYAPSAAVSETDIVVNWRTLNAGTGSTGSIPWTEAAYLSEWQQLGVVNDYFLGSSDNISALNNGQSYLSNPVSFRIPQGVLGLHYLIVKTDLYNSVREATDTNNTRIIPVNITLAPPPDLRVTNMIVAPSTVFSEDSLTVSFTIVNEGDGPTTTNPIWWEGIYISPNSTFDLATSTWLRAIRHDGSLNPSGTYQVSAKVMVPQGSNGVFYIYVIADDGNAIYEYSYEDNNALRSDAIQVIMRPAPDLVVHNPMVTTDTVSNRQPITVRWTGLNNGAAKADPSWYDQIFISSDPVFSPATDPLLSSVMHTETLHALDSVFRQQVVNVPMQLAEGIYYLFVKMDVNNEVFEAGGENNNTSVPAGPLTIANPDLALQQFTAPSVGTSQESITVSWKVKNIGRGVVYNSSWKESVYLSSDPTIDEFDKLLIAAPNSRLIPVNGEYTIQKNITLPEGISGNYYLIVSIDHGNDLTEKSESNNLGSSAISITLSPWPDLQITLVQTPAADTAGTPINFSYTEVNGGTGNIQNRQWRDQLYLSPSTNPNDPAAVLLGGIEYNRSLVASQSFVRQASFIIPYYLTPGTWYLMIQTDHENAIFENTGEANNRFVGPAINIGALPTVDLIAIGGTVVSTVVTAGEPATVQWTIRNGSSINTIIPSWEDAIYLSNNPILDGSDRLLASFSIAMLIEPDGTYTVTRSVDIPPDVSGNFYLLVNTDRYDNHLDINRGNNTLPLNSAGSPVTTIVQPPPSDLSPFSFNVPAEGTVLQPVSISYTIRNNGVGTTQGTSWKDNIYLSTDAVIGAGDILLGSINHSGSLLPGGQYTVSEQVFLPDLPAGNYILIIKTDAADHIYELYGEQNNIANAGIFIKSQIPCDLKITRVVAPDTDQLAGATCGVGWIVKNASNLPLQAYMREAVYLSADTNWDNEDVLFGTITGMVQLAPQGTINRQLSGRLENLTIGYYYVIVRTDILNNITETNEENNIAVSDFTFKVDVKELLMQVLTADDLDNGKPLYYRLEIPPGLVNETLSLSLKGDSANNAVNRIYLAHDRMPTQNDFDYSSLIPFEANQEIIVPELKQGGIL